MPMEVDDVKSAVAAAAQATGLDIGKVRVEEMTSRAVRVEFVLRLDASSLTIGETAAEPAPESRVVGWMLQSFLYDLLQAYVYAGDIEDVIKHAEALRDHFEEIGKPPSVPYSNALLGEAAKQWAKRLLVERTSTTSEEDDAAE